MFFFFCSHLLWLFWFVCIDLWFIPFLSASMFPYESASAFFKHLCFFVLCFCCLCVCVCLFVCLWLSLFLFLICFFVLCVCLFFLFLCVPRCRLLWWFGFVCVEFWFISFLSASMCRYVSASVFSNICNFICCVRFVSFCSRVDLVLPCNKLLFFCSL